MAVTSFKQQCPSCEAMVPIRDPNLIGRKIDCPKCKYRFVVEEPVNGNGAEEEAGAATVTTKALAKGERGTSSGAATAKTRRRRGEGEEFAEETPAPKLKSGSKAPIFIIGGVIGGLA